LDFITAGHTHLHRAIPRGNGRGYYYNTGTWVRLIQLRKNVLSSQKKFEEVYESLSAGSMKALDKHKDLVVRRPTAVRFAATDAGVTGELLSMESGKLETIPGTGYVRV
jgi:hypothetical protein